MALIICTSRVYQGAAHLFLRDRVFFYPVGINLKKMQKIQQSSTMQMSEECS